MKSVKSTPKAAVKSTTRKAVKKAIVEQDAEVELACEQIQESIRLKAYELFVERGCTHGNDREDWIAAEQIILGKA